MADRTLIIVPAYNEEENIVEVIREIKSALSEVDILVIDDGSSDATAKLAEKEADFCIRLPYHLGLGAALQTGYIFAKERNYDFVVHFDADGQHIAGEIEKILGPVKNGECDIAIGSRFTQLEKAIDEVGARIFHEAEGGSMPPSPQTARPVRKEFSNGVKKQNFLTGFTDSNNSKYDMPFIRRLATGLITKSFQLLMHRRIKDPTSGFRVMNKKVFSLFSRYYPSDYPEVEELLLLANNNLDIKEVPIKMRMRLKGKSSLTFQKSVFYMFKVLLVILLDSLWLIKSRNK